MFSKVRRDVEYYRDLLSLCECICRGKFCDNFTVKSILNCFNNEEFDVKTGKLYTDIERMLEHVFSRGKYEVASREETLKRTFHYMA